MSSNQQAAPTQDAVEDSDAENETPNRTKARPAARKSAGVSARKARRGAPVSNADDSDGSLCLSGEDVANLDVDDLLASDDEAAAAPVRGGKASKGARRVVPASGRRGAAARK